MFIGRGYFFDVLLPHSGTNNVSLLFFFAPQHVHDVGEDRVHEFRRLDQQVDFGLCAQFQGGCLVGLTLKVFFCSKDAAPKDSPSGSVSDAPKKSSKKSKKSKDNMTKVYTSVLDTVFGAVRLFLMLCADCVGSRFLTDGLRRRFDACRKGGKRPWM